MIHKTQRFPNTFMVKPYELVIIVFLGFIFSLDAGAMITPQPLNLYERGMEQIRNYRGNSSQLDEAQELFFTIIDKYPDSHFGYLGMSRIKIIEACRNSDSYNMDIIYNDALPLANKALDLGPSINEVYENYAVIEKIIDNDSNLRKKAKTYVTLFPDNAETFFMVGNFMYSHSELLKALEYFDMALKLNPSDDERIRILERIALIYLEGYNDPERAIGYYNEALKIHDSAVLNEYIGIAYFNLKNYEIAIQKLTKSLEQLPSSKIAEYYLLQAKGYEFQKGENLEKAIEFLEKAKSFDVKDSSLYFTLGNLYFKAKKYDAAYQHFKSVIDMDPNNPNAYFSAGESASSIGDKDLAKEYYLEYLKIQRDGQKADWIRTNYPEFSK